MSLDLDENQNPLPPPPPSGSGGDMGEYSRQHDFSAQQSAGTDLTGQHLDDEFDAIENALSSFSGDNLESGSVDTAQLADAAVTTAKLADDAVTSAKIADSPTLEGDVSITAGLGSGNLSVAGAITEGGNDVLNDTQKRIVVISDAFRDNEQNLYHYDGRLSLPPGIASGRILSIFAGPGDTGGATWDFEIQKFDETGTWVTLGSVTAAEDENGYNDTLSNNSFAQADGFAIKLNDNGTGGNMHRVGVVVELDW